jgi:small subunit ribosomal protein S16
LNRRPLDFISSPNQIVVVFERIPLVLMIRLARVGAPKQPHYRVVVIEKDRARNGRSVEVVGTYNPRTTPASLTLKRDRIDYWVGNGALLSDRVAKLYAAPVPAPAAEPAAAPVAAPVTESVAAPVAEPVAAPASEPVAETIAPSIAEPVAESAPAA